LKNTTTTNLKFQESNWGLALIIIMLALASWLPRSYKLDQFVTTDEVPWLVRSANFYYALGQREFDHTYYGHGTVTMWIETAVYLLDFPHYRGLGQGYFDSDKYWQYEEFISSQGVDPHDLLVKSRVLTVIVNVSLILAAYFFARLLFGTIPALIGFLLIAFDPFHISLTRLAHLDGLTGGFLFLSLLAFLAYLYVDRRTSYLVVSAISGGLAWLAKLPGLLIIPTVSLLTLISFLVERRDQPGKNSITLRDLTNQVIKTLAVWGIILLLSVIFISPAAWNNPYDILKKMTFSPLVAGNVIPTLRIEGKLIPKYSENNLPDIAASFIEKKTILSFLSQPISFFTRYPYRYLWQATPLVILGLVAAVYAYLFKISIFKGKKTRRAVSGLFFFLLIYTLFVTLASKSSYKYYLPVYPVLDLIAGLGWFAVIDYLAEKPIFSGKKYFKILTLSLIVLFQLFGTMSKFPYYSTYFNPLLGGSKKAGETLPVGSGEGLDQAARYLNQKPNSESLKVLSWYGIGPFSYFFKGETSPMYSNLWTSEMVSTLKEMDYMVVYSRQLSHNKPIGLLPLLEEVKPEHTIWIKGIEFARIYDVHQLPPEVYEPYNSEK